jgi:hypothetical protein
MSEANVGCLHLKARADLLFAVLRDQPEQSSIAEVAHLLLRNVVQPSSARLLPPDDFLLSHNV